MPKFDAIAFDADDTLWHSERLYAHTQAEFAKLLAHYCDEKFIHDRLYKTESRNLAHFGFGVKGFALSMIETAVELTEGRISGRDIQTIINLAKDMLTADVELLDGVSETIAALAQSHRLMVITKGELLDQEKKIERSGLGKYFHLVEIVSDKTPASYARLLAKHSLEPQNFFMVGNSLRSDILPILELGGSAAYIPYEITWLHETAEPPVGRPGFYQLEQVRQLPALLEKIEMISGR
jgi:putative hydrolase of the HAD superfamily